MRASDYKTYPDDIRNKLVSSVVGFIMWTVSANMLAAVLLLGYYLIMQLAGHSNQMVKLHSVNYIEAYCICLLAAYFIELCRYTPVLAFFACRCRPSWLEVVGVSLFGSRAINDGKKIIVMRG